MPIEISQPQRDALARSGSEPLRLTDPATGSGNILLQADEYDRLRASGGAFDVRETCPAQNAVASAAGWDEPFMDEYDVLCPIRGAGALRHTHW